MDRGALRATVHGVTKSRTRLKKLSMHYLINLLRAFSIYLGMHRVPASCVGALSRSAFRSSHTSGPISQNSTWMLFQVKFASSGA